MEAAGGALGALALSGAASWVKLDEGPKDARPTIDEYVQQAREEFGLGVEEDNTEKQREAAAWARDGGAEADELARRAKWEKQHRKVTEAELDSELVQTGSP